MVSITQVLEQFQKYRTDIALKNLTYNLLTREKHTSCGDLNGDTVFYVIRSINDCSPVYIGPVHNLLANYFYVLSHLAYAGERGWVPVVDQLNYPVYNTVAEPIGGTRNAWEYFWEQPSGRTLEEAYSSKNVVLSKRNWFGQWDMGYDIAKYRDADTVSFFSALADTVPLNEPTRRYCDELRDRLLPKDSRTMGVSVRIGGHSEQAFLPVSGHPIQAGNSEMLGICRKRFDEWSMEYVYLATDSDDTVAAFGQEFGDRLIVMPRRRSAAGQDSARDRSKPMYAPENIFQTSLDYLAEMEMLSSCTGLVGSVSSGLRYAVVRNAGRYENTDILDFGRIRDTRFKDTWEEQKR